MRRVGVLSVGVLIALLALGGVALQSCGNGNNDKRTREICEVCDGHIDEDCRRECRKFCLPTEDCEDRCTRECDQCKKDLSCQACAGSCTGAELRCAPIDEIVTCEDGRFGEGPEATSLPMQTLTPTPAATPIGGAT
jgi:hypothetical protein